MSITAAKWETAGSLGTLAAIALTSWITVVNSSSRDVYADAVIPILVSLIRWRPFFWEQSRFGMLVPLLAEPIAHPMWNMIAQYLASTACLIAAPFVIARFVCGRRAAYLAGAATSISLMALYANTWVWVMFASPGVSYPMSLTLVFGGLCILNGHLRLNLRVTAAAALVFSGLCPSVAFDALGIVAARSLITALYARGRFQAVMIEQLRNSLSQVVLLMVGLALTTALSLLGPGPEARLLVSLMSPRQWLRQQAGIRFARQFYQWFITCARPGSPYPRPGAWQPPLPPVAAALTALYVTAALSLFFTSAPKRRSAIIMVGALIGGVTSEFLVLSAMPYVALNGFSGHYLFSALMLIFLRRSHALWWRQMRADGKRAG